MSTKENPNYLKARSILRRYMSDWTVSKGGPPAGTGGSFALLVHATGKVYLGETTDFNGRHHLLKLSLIKPKSVNTNNYILAMIELGSKVSIWYLTQPDKYCIKKLEQELIEENLLVERSVRQLTTGKVYKLFHRTDPSYYLLASNSLLSKTQVISQSAKIFARSKCSLKQRFYTSFMSNNRGGVGLEVVEVGNYKNREELKLFKKQYVSKDPVNALNKNF